MQLAVDEINKAGRHPRPTDRAADARHRRRPDQGGQLRAAAGLQRQGAVHHRPGQLGRGASPPRRSWRAPAFPTSSSARVDELIDPAKYPRAFRVINTNLQWISTANNYATKTLKKTQGRDDRRHLRLRHVAAQDSAEQLLDKAGIKPVYSVLVDPNKTDLTDEMNKAKAAGADVVMPWSAATGLLASPAQRARRHGLERAGGGPPRADGGADPEAPQQARVLGQHLRRRATRAPPTARTASCPARTQALVDKIAAKLGGGEIDVLFWWVALGYDTVKVIEHAVKTAGSIDPAAIQKVLENTKDFRGVYASYTWGPNERNGFPDANMAMNAASTFKDGSFKPAPALTAATPSDAAAAMLTVIVSGLAIGMVYAAVALVYNVMYSTSKVLSVTTGHIAMLGGVFGAWFIAALSLHWLVGLAGAVRSAPRSAG